MSEEIKKTTSSSLPSQSMVDLYVKTKDFDIQDILPSQIDTDLRIEERQETTRSQLATFLIKILAGTLSASFSILIVLIIMTGFIGEKNRDAFDKTTTLAKDLITFILTAQTGLIGTALGFYFGSRGGNSD